MIYSRIEVAEAVGYWGVHGSGQGPLTISREASMLVDILATMDFSRETSVEVRTDTARGHLLRDALHGKLQIESDKDISPDEDVGMQRERQRV